MFHLLEIANMLKATLKQISIRNIERNMDVVVQKGKTPIDSYILMRVIREQHCLAGNRSCDLGGSVSLG